MTVSKDEQHGMSQARRAGELPAEAGADQSDPSTKSQIEKFADLAREVDADDSDKAFDAALRRMRERTKKHEPDGVGQ